MRLSPDIKAKAEKASALLGVRSLTEYIVRLIDENSTKAIQQYESMTVKNDIFDNFMKTCEKQMQGGRHKALLQVPANAAGMAHLNAYKK